MISTGYPPFRPSVIRVTHVIVLLIPALAAWYSLKHKGHNLYPYVIPAMIVVSMIGGKIAARLVPWRHVLGAAICIISIHSLLEYLVLHMGVSPLLMVLTDLGIAVVCKLGFGRHWVKKRYIPPHSNWWPD